MLTLTRPVHHSVDTSPSPDMAIEMFIAENDCRWSGDSGISIKGTVEQDDIPAHGLMLIENWNYN